MKILVAQLGARAHYAIPRMLYSSGMLGHFFTDICGTKGWPRLLNAIPRAYKSQEVKRLLGRIPIGVPSGFITAFSNFGFQYARRRATAASLSEMTATHIWAGRTFCNKILRRGLGNVSAVYVFNSAGLELMNAAKSLGIKTIMEQTIAPREIESALLEEEHSRYPEWEERQERDIFLREFIAREKEEWSQADVILCGSEFVKNGVVEAGGIKENCIIVPYGVDDNFSMTKRLSHSGPLRVLTIGSVGLRKGTPYVLDAAKKLKGKAVFRIIGSIGVCPAIVRELRDNLELLGPVPRRDIVEHFAWADIFLLPSLCEGSSIATYEALSASLPVICTNNTGSIVRDGIEGYIVPRNSAAIIEKIEHLASNPELLNEMSRNAGKRAQKFTLDAYSSRLTAALSL